MKVGWRNVFVRRMERCPVISASDPVETLRNVVGGIAGPGPILHSSGTYIGRVKNGFSLSIGQSVSLYGYSHSNSIPVLGAHVGPNPDDSKLAEAFAKLNLSHGVILVDWRAQMVLVSVDRDGQIEVWRP